MNKTFNIIVQAALCGARCPTNDNLGKCGAARLSQMAARGDVLIEVYPKNFRRVTILVGEHAGKRTADPPRLNNGLLPKPHITVSERGSLRTRPVPAAGPEKSPTDFEDMTPYHKLRPWQPLPFTPPNVHPSIQNKIRGGRA